MESMSPRYALYFTPDPRSEWHARWSQWLGRDAVTGQRCDQTRIDGVDAKQWFELTRAPRLYGLHATLKAPFHLAPGRQLADLQRSLHDYCRRQPAFRLPRLEVCQLDRFLALTMAFAHSPVERVAAECVEQFDHFRAAPTVHETARRRRAPLSARELALLDRWGYPYVMDCYRFHFSITGDLAGVANETVVAIREAATKLAQELSAQPMSFDAVSLFAQPAPGQEFLLHERVPFG